MAFHTAALDQDSISARRIYGSWSSTSKAQTGSAPRFLILFLPIELIHVLLIAGIPEAMLFKLVPGLGAEVKQLVVESRLELAVAAPPKRLR
jgi:hypothetical protein